jgi:pyrrolidone-carboxylate peptidase
MKYFLFIALGLLISLKSLKAQEEYPNIMVTGYWNPTGKMISHFSTDTLLNKLGWKGENWMGLGFNVHSFFPKPGSYTGVFEVDYQNVQADFKWLTDSLKPVAIVSFGAGTGPWEIEKGARNMDSWYSDGNDPEFPTPNPPDSTIEVGQPRFSSLPIEAIKAAVNSETSIRARIDTTNDMGRFICEYTGFTENWYHDTHSDSAAWPCYRSGFIHVKNTIYYSTARTAANITVRETAKALMEDIQSIYGYVSFSDSSEIPEGIQVTLSGDTNRVQLINNDDGRFTFPFTKNGTYHLTVNIDTTYVFDSVFVVADSSKRVDVVFKKIVGTKAKSMDNFKLVQNYPNPFSENTTIGFYLKTPSQVKITVFDISGRPVKVLANKAYTAGVHSVVWNGNTDKGSALKPGMYIYQMMSNGVKVHKQCIYIN